MRRIYQILFFCILSVFSLRAEVLSSNAQISLLTCSPGQELYSKFGHTAIRVFDPEQHIDIVFNYGMFSFYSEHFYARFIKGETDYRLGINPIMDFREEYDMRGRQIYEQILSLTQAEKEAVYKALIVNYRPENRIYRYNFVYDNCATRPYYLLKNNISGTLVAPEFGKRSDTYRQIIAYYTGKYSWAYFGISLIFGKDADRIMTPEQRLFLPEELMNFVSEANIKTEGENYKLTEQEHTEAFSIQQTSWLASPYLLIVILIGLIGVISWLDVKYKKKSYWFDAVLFFIYGILGTLMCYLSFCSLHPLVKNNFNILFFNPLMLILGLTMCFRKGQAFFEKIECGISVYLLIAILIWLFSGQTLHPIVWIIAAHWLRIQIIRWDKKRTFWASCHACKKHKTIAISGLILLGASSIQAQTPPRLVVAVVVDGLHQQNMTLLEPYFEQGGLRTLQKEGCCIPQLYFPQLINGGVESVATICTGTTPYYHGISEDYYFDSEERKIYSILTDYGQTGIGTTEQISARNLLSSTISDQLKLKYGEKSKVYAVGIDAAETVVMAGHSANAAAWIDDANMRWISTSYYTEGLSPWADEMNINERFSQIAAREWQPRLTYDMYIWPTEKEKKDKGFEYTGNQFQNKNATHTILKNTPAANALVIELALKIQEKEKLGIDLQPDMLLLQLTTQTPTVQSDLIHSAEQEDMYMRLNQDLGFLITQLTKHISKEHLLIMVIGKPNIGELNESYMQNNVPIGLFNVGRSAALINTYLMALYGHERWIDGSYNNRIFLNRRLIEEKKLNLADMQTQVANFLLEFEGVQSAFTASQITGLTGNAYNHLDEIRNSYNKKSGGDVIFTLQPGWVVADEKNKPIDAISELRPTVPLYLWGMNIAKQTINGMHPATEIAPYLCQLLQIQVPNACTTDNKLLSE